jgi:3-hydroxyacyl-[acyl-carrier-protein] dehydratase
MLLDIRQIQEILPHRYPFLLVDRVLEIEPGKRIVGLKNVTATEHFFQGHFPAEPLMPGVLILEALAQVGAILVLRDFKAQGQIMLFAGMDEVLFRRKVVPGDQLRLEAEVDRIRMPFGRLKGRALVDGEVAAQAILKFMLQPKDKPPAAGGT